MSTPSATAMLGVMMCSVVDAKRNHRSAIVITFDEHILLLFIGCRCLLSVSCVSAIANKPMPCYYNNSSIIKRYCD